MINVLKLTAFYDDFHGLERDIYIEYTVDEGHINIESVLNKWGTKQQSEFVKHNEDTFIEAIEAELKDGGYDE